MVSSSGRRQHHHRGDAILPPVLRVAPRVGDQVDPVAACARGLHLVAAGAVRQLHGRRPALPARRGLLRGRDENAPPRNAANASQKNARCLIPPPARVPVACTLDITPAAPWPLQGLPQPAVRQPHLRPDRTSARRGASPCTGRRRGCRLPPRQPASADRDWRPPGPAAAAVAHASRAEARAPGTSDRSGGARVPPRRTHRPDPAPTS